MQIHALVRAAVASADAAAAAGRRLRAGHHAAGGTARGRKPGLAAAHVGRQAALPAAAVAALARWGHRQARLMLAALAQPAGCSEGLLPDCILYEAEHLQNEAAARSADVKLCLLTCSSWFAGRRRRMRVRRWRSSGRIAYQAMHMCDRLHGQVRHSRCAEGMITIYADWWSTAPSRLPLNLPTVAKI